MAYRYEIQKEFHFSASHQLQGLPEGHQCGRLHGHNYIVVVVLGSNELDEHGFVVDYGELKPVKNYIDEVLDHRHLNDVLPFQSTAENLAEHLYNFAKSRWKEVIEVRVSETPKTWSTYRGV
jgi:6-pyruvoyltetrahydropterin/6-carboxytetrahydropterin synthase